MGQTQHRMKKDEEKRRAMLSKYCVFPIRMALRPKSARRGENAETATPLYFVGRKRNFIKRMTARCQEYTILANKKSASAPEGNFKKNVNFRPAWIWGPARGPDTKVKSRGIRENLKENPQPEGLREKTDWTKGFLVQGAHF